MREGYISMYPARDAGPRGQVRQVEVGPVGGDELRCRLVAQEFAKGDEVRISLLKHTSSSRGEAAGHPKSELAGKRLDLHGLRRPVCILVCRHQKAGVH